MTMLPTATPAGPATPARLLPAPARQQLALSALTGQAVAALADQHQVSRKFVYQQAHHAQQALDQAFAPPPDDDDKVLFNLPVTGRFLKRLTLASLLCCHSSYRGVCELLDTVFHVQRSTGYVAAVARAAMTQARGLNEQQGLANVRIGAHDEIFQAGQPVLVGVDTDSTYCYLLSPEEHRDGATWGVRLLELQDQGFRPDAVVSDRGSGLRAGHELALPAVPQRGDVFHLLYEVQPLVRTLEGRAYEALATCVKLERRLATTRWRRGRLDQSVLQKLRLARAAAAHAVAVADDVTTLVRWLRDDVLAVAGPDHATRQELYDFIVAELRARQPLGPAGLRDAVIYLTNQRDAALAFARQLDDDLAEVAEQHRVPVALVRELLQVEQTTGYDGRRWSRAAALYHHLGGRVHELRTALAAVVRGTVRASALVENFNSRLRNYFFLRRQVGPDYLHLLRFYLNHRPYPRSHRPERAGHSPRELLTGQRHAPWLEMLGLPDPLRN
jgi:hypothetical protein